LADKDSTIEKMKEEKTKKDNEIDTFNKKVTTLESQLKDKQEKLAVKTAEYKKLEEIAGQMEKDKENLI
jgi:peptidoglycan hydrolase CwlO-like protein